MKRQIFLQFADKIRACGFTVLVNYNWTSKLSHVASNFGVFTDGTNIGRFDDAGFDQPSINLSTAHKPCACGTGFMVKMEVTLGNLTPELLRACFVAVPRGFEHVIGTFGKAEDIVRKYENFEDWKRNSPYVYQYEPYEPQFRYTTRHINDVDVVVRVYKSGDRRIYHKFIVQDHGDWNAVEAEIESVVRSL